MNKKENWDLLVNFLAGECSKEEEEQVIEWIELNSENKKEYEMLKKIWNTPGQELPKSDVETAFKKVVKRVKIPLRVEDSIAEKTTVYKPKTKKILFLQDIFKSRIVRAAAVFFFVILTPYLLLKIFKSTSFEQFFSTLKETVVENGERSEIILSDDTKITLDSGSMLRFPETFTGNTREVFLDGEGFFEVTSDPDKPFIIHANEAVIEVLGTKFNVRAWSESKKTEVVVTEGRVSLSSETQKEKDPGVIISKGQISILKENEKPIIPKNTDVERYLLWQNREMDFRNTPLQEVLDQLERWYDLEFYLTEKSYASNRIKIYIENKPIEDILEMVCLVLNFEYERKDNRITFSPKDSNE